jgi:hypothetical protein
LERINPESSFSLKSAICNLQSAISETSSIRENRPPRVPLLGRRQGRFGDDGVWHVIDDRRDRAQERVDRLEVFVPKIAAPQLRQLAARDRCQERRLAVAGAEIRVRALSSPAAMRRVSRSRDTSSARTSGGWNLVWGIGGKADFRFEVLGSPFGE